MIMITRRKIDFYERALHNGNEKPRSMYEKMHFMQRNKRI